MCGSALSMTTRPTRRIGSGRIDVETERVPGRGGFVWFTTCLVVVAKPAEEFAFEVTTFGLPVSRWGYRRTAVGRGTEVTEYWLDRRTRGARVLGRIFTGRVVTQRPQANRDGMRTLSRLKQDLERPSPARP